MLIFPFFYTLMKGSADIFLLETLNVPFVVDHAVHCRIRRHGSADVAREIHSLFLRATGNIVLCTPRGEYLSLARLICLLHVLNQ